MKVQIITPEKYLYDGEATAVIFPGEEGYFSVHDHHAPMIAALKYGEIRLESKSGKQEFVIMSGVCEINKNNVIICVNEY